MSSTRSDKSHARLDIDSRTRKARTMIDILSAFVSLRKSSILDVGTGAGVIAAGLSGVSKHVTSVDILDERIKKGGYKFKLVKDEVLPFREGSFDVVISNHVIEHVPNQALHLKEIKRVLKPGGMLYIATPNRLWIMDPHYRVPFINWMPRRIAAAYLRVIKSKEWDIYPITTRRLKILASGFDANSMIPTMMKAHLNNTRVSSKIIRRLLGLPAPILSITQYASPTLVFTLTKYEER